MVKIVIVISILFCFISSAHSQRAKIPGQSEFEMAEDLFQSKKYTSWLSILEMAVVKNHPKATIRKGDAYYLGLGVEQNYSGALKWYKKAAELNDVGALFLIDDLYRNNFIEGETYAVAVKYYLTLNSKGINAANMFIGEAYLEGNGISKNIDSALVWFEKGVTVSDPGCLYSLGDLYRNGTGVDKNITKAIDLMEQACNEGFLISCEELGGIYYKGEGVDANADESVKWYTKGVELDGAKSHFYYSNYILLGYIDGTKSEAISYAKKAKKLGYDSAACDWLQIKINGEMK